MFKHGASALACIAALAVSAGTQGPHDSITLAGRLYPSGDLTAVVIAEMRPADLPEVGRASAADFARLQMRSNTVSVETLAPEDKRSARASTQHLQYRLAIRPWILPTEETAERPAPSVLLATLSERWRARAPDELKGPVELSEVSAIDIDPIYDVTFPADRAIDRGFAAYRCAYTLEDGKLTIRRTLQVRNGKVSADAVQSFASEVERDLNAPIVIRRLDASQHTEKLEGGMLLAGRR